MVDRKAAANQAATPDQLLLKKVAKRELKLREVRATLFGRGLSREVAWDMLLVLYAFDHRLTIGALTKAISAPATTALRWIEFLEDRGMVEKKRHPNDARVQFVTITDQAQRLLELYLSETSRTFA